MGLTDFVHRSPTAEREKNENVLFLHEIVHVNALEIYRWYMRAKCMHSII